MLAVLELNPFSFIKFLDSILRLCLTQIIGKSKPTLRAADLLFKKTESKMVNKKNRRLCADDPSQTFTECARQKLPDVLKNNSIDCVTSFWKNLQDYSNLTFCDINATRARQVMFVLIVFFSDQPFL